MKKNRKIGFYASPVLIILFIIWTVLVRFIDVEAIGPNESSVGFSTLNGFFHALTGVHLTLYIITDWLGLIPVAIALSFALLGLLQWIRRRSFLKVDRTLIVLGAFYIALIAVYFFFEAVVINYRPVLIDGYSEPSYPSSTTMLVMCVMPTAIMQLNSRIKSTLLRRFASISISLFTAFMVIGRLVSGVHWITDIIGGSLISSALVVMYYSFSA